MKNIKHIILPAIALAGMMQSPLFAQGLLTPEKSVTASTYIRESDVPMRLVPSADGKLRIAFDVDLKNRKIGSGQALLIMPRFKNGTWSKDLPAVMVEGRRFRIITNDRLRFDGNNCDLSVMQRLAAKDAPASYHYQTEIEYTPEMRGATLELVTKECRPCGKKGLCGRDEKVSLLARGVTDYSDFITADVALYLFPEIALKQYTNNFGNKSVFRLGQSNINMTTFNQDGYNDFRKELDALKNDPKVAITKIKVTCAASPDGSYKFNEVLAKKRTDKVAGLVRRDVKGMNIPVETESIAENWEAFDEELGKSDLSNIEQIRNIIDTEPDFDRRDAQLRILNNYSKIYKLFQNLRNCNISIEYKIEETFGEEVEIEEMALGRVSSNNTTGSQLDFQRIMELYNEKATTKRANNMMVALMRQGKYEEALKYAEMIEAKDLDAVIANNKAALYQITGESLMAATFAEKAAQMPEAGALQSWIALTNGNFANLASNAKSCTTNDIVASIYAGNYAQAAAQSHLASPSAANTYLRAVAYAMMNENKAALSTLKAACKANAQYKTRALNDGAFIGLISNPEFVAITQ